MPEYSREQLLELSEGEPLSTEHLDEKVQIASQQEQSLKRQLEIIERQKRELEEMSRRQEMLNVGKSEMMDKITRALVILEREIFEASKRVETLDVIQGSFTNHLETLESINPKAWEGLDISKELTRSLASVDDAKAEYGKSFPKISNLQTHESHATDEGGYAADSTASDSKDFISWLKIGFAFSLPLLVFGLLALIVIASRIK